MHFALCLNHAHTYIRYLKIKSAFGYQFETLQIIPSIRMCIFGLKMQCITKLLKSSIYPYLTRGGLRQTEKAPGNRIMVKNPIRTIKIIISTISYYLEFCQYLPQNTILLKSIKNAMIQLNLPQLIKHYLNFFFQFKVSI